VKKLRAAIYARHSTDKQNPTSSQDQVDACRPLVEQIGAELVETYTDPEISGYRRDRPGLMRMLRDVANGHIDVVVCEALDRIARDGEDISWLGKKLSYHRVRLFTNSEREIDEVKLAVAGLIGSMFLSNLRTKTFRGLKAAVLAGRLAGGKAYGYRKVAGQDDAGRTVNGIFEIYPEEAEIVRRICREFAAGRSPNDIAVGLNRDGIPSPRGGEWGPSTVRGDPKKLVGILHNPLYRGRLIWGRREWRKNPDSDRRERRYRLRDQSEWIEVDMPDLRIVDEQLVAQVDAEVKRRQVPEGTRASGSMQRAKHLLSGLIHCGACGAKHTLVGKDYYRCVRNKDRGTCAQGVTVRLNVVEDAVLGALQSKLLTPDLVKLFKEEFNREVARLTRSRDEADQDARERLTALEIEISNLAQHFLQGTVSPTLTAMLNDRENEKAQILQRLSVKPAETSTVIPHPMLVKRYEEKVGRLRDALNDETVRSDAISALRSLISSVEVHVDESGEAMLQVEASTSTLIDFAEPRAPGGRSTMLVAGVGFEPTTFRL